MPNEPKKILMLTAELGYGGAESAFLRLAEHLSTRADVTIVIMSRIRATSEYEAYKALVGRPILTLSDEIPPTRRILATFLRWRRMTKALRELKRQHDATISFLSGPNLLNGLAGGTGITIISERGSKRFDSGMAPRQRWLWTTVLDRISYRRASYIVAASAGLAGEISKANPRISRRLHVIEGTVLSRQLVELADAPIEPECSAFSHYPTVISFGRLHVSKGFDALISIFAKVRSREPRARLVLIGDGPLQMDLMAQARSLGLRSGVDFDPESADIVFAGYRPNPVRYLRLARVFALTSRNEGLPNALIEALAAGVPIVAADCPWGPRSILSGPRDQDMSPTGVLPQTLTHGTLMPMVDAPGAGPIWEGKLVDELARAPRRRSKEDCLDAISRFDIEVTGPKWFRLVHSPPVRSASLK